MVRRITIVGLIIYYMVISFAFAGTWRDGFEDGDLERWESPDPNPGPEEKWGVEDGECSGQWANTTVGVCSAVILALEGVALWRDYSVVYKAKLV